MIIRAVVDILGGVVVRGIQGQRDDYAPIRSSLTKSTAPDDIARALHETFGLIHFYIADLDAIVHQKNPDWKLLESWATRNWDIWADIGVACPGDLAHWPLLSGITAVIGTESWSVSPDDLPDKLTPPVVLSLDHKSGVLCGEGGRQFSSPGACLNAWATRCIPDLLWMDLGKVGSYGGPTQAREIAFARTPGKRIHAAGGVRGPEDLVQLQKDGFDGVLVASALHDGRLAKI